MTFTIPESGIIPVEYFKDLLDISKISYYNLEEKDGVLTLRFYDSKKKLIHPFLDRVCGVKVIRRPTKWQRRQKR